MQNMKSDWELLHSETVYTNKKWSVQHDKVRMPNGIERDYYIVNTTGAVDVVALTNNREIYLVGQYRHTTGVYSLEVPGGGMDDNSPLQAAKRELIEETGLTAKSWKSLGSFQTSNGIMSELTHIFLATDLTTTDNNTQFEEGIDELIKIPVVEAIEMINDGRITHAQTIVCIMKAGLELGIIGTC